MNKLPIVIISLLCSLCLMAQQPAISISGDTTLIATYVDTIVPVETIVPADTITQADTVVAVPEQTPDLKHMQIYKRDVVKQNCFFVVSKKEFILSVYEVVKQDTVFVATFPICYGKNPGNKTKTGDGCTPECSYQKPFYISEIKDSHAWRHDFGDGRGNILAYGHWFMRLDLSRSDCHPNVRSNRSIGIHGSTNNASSVPGRGSEGCIRLRDKDLLVLHDLYAIVGTKVIVLPTK